MPEPTLSELTNIQADADLGTAGLTDYVPTSMRLVNQQIADQSKFRAEMNWKKYTQFLQNFKEISKDAQAISSEDIAAPDREYLQGEMKNIFSEIAKNPKSALGGQGMFAIQEKLNKLQSDAMQSKQDNMFDKYHRMFLDRNPDMKTDENKTKVETYLPNQKLGTRQPYMLDAPAPELDTDKLFGGILKSSTRPFSENNINPVDVNGKPLEGYIQTETGEEVNPKTIKALWDLTLKSHPTSAKSIKQRYEKLPEEIKQQYDKPEGGGVAQFFSDLGKEYLQAQFPEGSYTPTKEGNYRFNKKSELKADPNYLGKQKLSLDWYKARTARIDATKPTAANKPPEVIEQPAILFGNHIDRLKKTFETGEYPNGIFISYAGTDPKTRIALGLKEGETVGYKPDGSYIVIGEDGKNKTSGTIDNLAQGYIEAVKTTDIDPDTDKDGTMAAGFQQKSEAAMNKLFGTTSGKKIWDTWKQETKKDEKAAEGKYPLPKGKPRFVKQDGVIYEWDTKTGQYQ